MNCRHNAPKHAVKARFAPFRGGYICSFPTKPHIPATWGPTADYAWNVMKVACWNRVIAPRQGLPRRSVEGVR